MRAGLVLAAGFSRRFGTPKQLAIVQGEPLVKRACRTALQAGLDPVLLVLGAHGPEVLTAVSPLSVRPLFNPQAAVGMGTSVALGAKAVLADQNIEELTVLLSDQPWVTVEHLTGLSRLREERAAWVAASAYGGTLGVPATFHRSLFPALAKLRGDRGARDLIRGTANRVELSFEPAAFDVDVPVDLDRKVSELG